MTLDIYHTVILGSIFITTIMLLLFSYILKGYRKLTRFFYQKAVRKYPNKIQDNHFALKLLSLAIQIYLYAMYSVLIYFIITLVLPYKR
jgi:hypothetical protein